MQSFTKTHWHLFTFLSKYCRYNTEHQSINQSINQPISPFPLRFSLTVWTALRTCQSSVTSSCTTWIFLELSCRLRAPSRSTDKHPANTVKPCLSRFSARLCPKPLSHPTAERKRTYRSNSSNETFLWLVRKVPKFNNLSQHINIKSFQVY